MKIFYFDSTPITAAYIEPLFDALGQKFIRNYTVDKEWLNGQLLNSEDVSIIVAHENPRVRLLRSWMTANVALKDVKVIRIGISESAPRLRIADSFVDGVAEFEWPGKAGAGIGDLGAALAASESSGVQWTVEGLLAAIQECMTRKYVLEKLVAAYLVSTCFAGQERSKVLGELDLHDYVGLSTEDMRTQLTAQIV